MRYYEFKLTESKGIFGRKPGEPYINANGATAEFVQTLAIPDITQGGKFDSVEERDEAIVDFEKNEKAQITWINLPNAGTLAFGIAQIRTSDGKDIYWGKYLRQVKADMMGTWGNKEIPADWKLATPGATKLDSGLDPQTLIGTPNYMRGPQEVIQTVERNAQPDTKEILVQALTDSAQGKMAVFPGQIQSLPAIRDYFGEIMGPVAMMGGAVKGHADAARHELAGGAEWKNLQIFWPQSMNYNLMDSVFIAPDGKQIGISSKGAPGGASASAKNLYDSVQKNKDNAELMETVKFTREIVTIIAENTSKNAPYVLGEMFGLTTPELKKEVISYIKTGKNELTDISDEAKNVIQGIKFNTTVQGFNVGYAITSGVAKKVAAHVNNNPEFSKGAIALLNTASIIQLYTKVGRKGDDVYVVGYDAVYPPNFQGNIALDGSKNYYSSRIGGKFAFKFIK